MTIVSGTLVYSNVNRRLVTFDEPGSHVVQITPGAFGAPMNGPQLNTFTFQFTGGGGGAPTMAIEVMGPAGAWSAYTNSGGDAATGITAGSAYIVDTGSWPQFRVTWTGSDASAVLSVLGWNSSATVPALQAELATAQADIQALQTEVVPLRDGFIFATDYGLVTGGDRDDADANTLALQAALNAAGNADTVVLPAGRIAIGDGVSVTTGQSVSILGAGVAPWTPVADVFGNNGWDTAAVSVGQGSILETESDTGAVITIHGSNKDPRVVLANFAIRGIGDDTRTVVGFDLGSTLHAARVDIQNVCAWNLATGFNLTNCQSGTTSGIQAVGCDVGIALNLNSNANVHTGLTTSACNTGVLLTECTQNAFVGGSIQSSQEFGVQSLGGTANSFSNIYFESSVGAAYSFSLENAGGHATGSEGRYNTITDCHFGDVGDTLDIWANSNTLLSNNDPVTVRLEANTTLNLIQAPGSNLTVTDLGTSNRVVNGASTTSSTGSAGTTIETVNFKSGLITSAKNVSRVLVNSGFDLTTSLTNTLQTLFTYSAPAGLLAANGDAFHGVVEYDLLAGTDTLAFQIGGTGIANQVDTATVGLWRWEYWIRRTGATTGKTTFFLLYAGGLYQPPAFAGNNTWANSLDLIVQLKCNSANGDAYVRRVFLEYVQAI